MFVHSQEYLHPPRLLWLRNVNTLTKRVKILSRGFFHDLIFFPLVLLVLDTTRLVAVDHAHTCCTFTDSYVQHTPAWTHITHTPYTLRADSMQGIHVILPDSTWVFKAIKMVNTSILQRLRKYITDYTNSKVPHNERPRQCSLICDAKSHRSMFWLCYCALFGEDINASLFLKFYRAPREFYFEPVNHCFYSAARRIVSAAIEKKNNKCICYQSLTYSLRFRLINGNVTAIVP